MMARKRNFRLTRFFGEKARPSHLESGRERMYVGPLTERHQIDGEEIQREMSLTSRHETRPLSPLPADSERRLKLRVQGDKMRRSKSVASIRTSHVYSGTDTPPPPRAIFLCPIRADRAMAMAGNRPGALRKKGQTGLSMKGTNWR